MAKEKTSNASNPISSFLKELMRRRVLQIGGAYIAGAWLGAEIFSFLFEQFQAPSWSYRLLAIIFVVGFPISMVLAWVIQVKEDGRWEIDPMRGDTKTLTVAMVSGLLITAGLSWLILPQREPPPVYEPLPSSLAVLPFADPATTPHERQAADTLYRSLMEGLEQSLELTLVRLGPGEQPGDMAVFGESLGVAGLASGQFGKSGAGAHIDVRMLDVVTGEVSWSQSYDWDATQIVETANAIANGLLQAMDLPPLEQGRFTGTDNRGAYEAFLAGEQHAATLDPNLLKQAVEEFQVAIDMDPGYVQAYVGLAQALYDMLETDGLPESERQEIVQRAHRAVDIAQKFDPDSAEAISLLGLELDNRQLRIQTWERALELDPDHAISYFRYARELKEAGKLEEAERLLERAVTLSPANARFRTELAEVFSLQGREEEAQAELEKVAQLWSRQRSSQ